MSDESLVTLGGGAPWRAEEDSEPTPSEEPQSPEDRVVFGPGDESEESNLPTEGLSPVNIRNFSVKCAYCGTYQVIVQFRQVDEDWNEYVYECDEPPCSAEVERSRTILEIPTALDEYASRDPTWHGGKVHAGADHQDS